MYISRMLVNLCKATTNFEFKNINNNKKKRQKVTAGVGIKGCPQLEGIMPFFVNFTMLTSFADAKISKQSTGFCWVT